MKLIIENDNVDYDFIELPNACPLLVSKEQGQEPIKVGNCINITKADNMIYGYTTYNTKSPYYVMYKGDITNKKPFCKLKEIILYHW